MSANTVEHIVGDSVWVTPEWAQDLAVIGVGTYGCVCSGTDRRTGEKVAIKKLRQAQYEAERAIIGRRTYREIYLLRRIHHDNIVSLRDIFVTAERASKECDVYLVTELLGADLSQLVEQGVGKEYVKCYVYQIAKALHFLHSAGIIHRDLKPDNVAINDKNELKLLDFGLARTRSSNPDLTEYLSTRWYRAPEIMLNVGIYNQAVDMWSLGCIMAELLSGVVLFLGCDTNHQMAEIVALLGKPHPTLMPDEGVRHLIMSLPNSPPKNFRDIFPGLDVNAIDLLQRLLVFDPAGRLTAEQVLAHPYCANYHDLDEEPVSPSVLDCSFESLNLIGQEWQRLVEQEIAAYHSEKQQPDLKPEA